MRWDELFADIEGQLEQELDAERLDIAAEEERLRLGRLALRDRIQAMTTEERALRLILADGESIEVRVESTGRDWVSGTITLGSRERTVIVPLSALAGVIASGGQLAEGLRAPTLRPELSAQLGLAFVLRDLGRRRASVDLHTRAGVVHGTIDRVGRDHVDFAEHDADEVRRTRVVRRMRLVPLDAILSIRI